MHLNIFVLIKFQVSYSTYKDWAHFISIHKRFRIKKINFISMLLNKLEKNNFGNFKMCMIFAQWGFYITPFFLLSDRSIINDYALLLISKNMSALNSKHTMIILGHLGLVHSLSVGKRGSTLYLSHKNRIHSDQKNINLRR